MKFKQRVHTRRVIIHDSHTTPDVIRATDVLRWQGMKMGLLDIGYHWVIERDGTPVATRDEAVIGTHTPGCNLDSIGVCLVGGRERPPLDEWGNVYPDHASDNFTEDQRIALFDLLLGIKLRYPGIAVFGHTEVQKYRNRALPDCPCLDMHELRADLLTYKETGIA